MSQYSLTLSKETFKKACALSYKASSQAITDKFYKLCFFLNRLDPGNTYACQEGDHFIFFCVSRTNLEVIHFLKNLEYLSLDKKKRKEFKSHNPKQYYKTQKNLCYNIEKHARLLPEEQSQYKKPHCVSTTVHTTPPGFSVSRVDLKKNDLLQFFGLKKRSSNRAVTDAFYQMAYGLDLSKGSGTAFQAFVGNDENTIFTFTYSHPPCHMDNTLNMLLCLDYHYNKKGSRNKNFQKVRDVKRVIKSLSTTMLLSPSRYKKPNNIKKSSSTLLHSATAIENLFLEKEARFRSKSSLPSCVNPFNSTNPFDALPSALLDSSNANSSAHSTNPFDALPSESLDSSNANSSAHSTNPFDALPSESLDSSGANSSAHSTNPFDALPCALLDSSGASSSAHSTNPFDALPNEFPNSTNANPPIHPANPLETVAKGSSHRFNTQSFTKSINFFKRSHKSSYKSDEDHTNMRL